MGEGGGSGVRGSGVSGVSGEWSGGPLGHLPEARIGGVPSTRSGSRACARGSARVAVEAAAPRITWASYTWRPPWADAHALVVAAKPVQPALPRTNSRRLWSTRDPSGPCASRWTPRQMRAQGAALGQRLRVRVKLLLRPRRVCARSNAASRQCHHRVLVNEWCTCHRQYSIHSHPTPGRPLL